jgi:hypothetical protein
MSDTIKIETSIILPEGSINAQGSDVQDILKEASNLIHTNLATLIKQKISKYAEISNKLTAEETQQSENGPFVSVSSNRVYNLTAHYPLLDRTTTD